MRKVIALKRHVYNRTQKEVDDRYECPDNHAKVLVVSRRVAFDEEAEAPTAPPVPETGADVRETRALVTEPEEAAPAGVIARRHRRPKIESTTEAIAPEPPAEPVEE